MLAWKGECWQSVFSLHFVFSTSSPCCNIFFFKVSKVLRPKPCWRAAWRWHAPPPPPPTPPHPSHERSTNNRCTWHAPPHPTRTRVETCGPEGIDIYTYAWETYTAQRAIGKHRQSKWSLRGIDRREVECAWVKSRAASASHHWPGLEFGLAVLNEQLSVPYCISNACEYD